MAEEKPEIRDVQVFEWNVKIGSGSEPTGVFIFRMKNYKPETGDGFLKMYPFQLIRFSRSPGGRCILLQKVLLSLGKFDADTCYVLANQIVEYLICSLWFRGVKPLPPDCPSIVFLVDFQWRTNGDTSTHTSVRQIRNQSSNTDDEDLVINLMRSIYCTSEGHQLVRLPSTYVEIISGYEASDGEVCCLCLEGYPKEGEVVFRTACNHIFHGACISTRLAWASTCPLCCTEYPVLDVYDKLSSCAS